MEDRIEKYGWDEKGGYYIYARTDDDIIMGSADCDEGQIFLISQLWSVLALSLIHIYCYSLFPR